MTYDSFSSHICSLTLDLYSALICFGSVQSLSRVRLFAIPWIAAHQASLSITNYRSSLRLVHRVSDAIQPSHPLSSPSPPAPNPSQHQGFFQWVNSLHEVAKVLEFQLQHQSFQWISRTDFLNGLIGLIGSPCIPRDSQESSPTQQFKSINSLALSFLYNPTLTSIHDHWKGISYKTIKLVDLYIFFEAVYFAVCEARMLIQNSG